MTEAADLFLREINKNIRKHSNKATEVPLQLLSILSLLTNNVIKAHEQQKEAVASSFFTWKAASHPTEHIPLQAIKASVVAFLSDLNWIYLKSSSDSCPIDIPILFPNITKLQIDGATLSSLVTNTSTIQIELQELHILGYNPSLQKLDQLLTIFHPIHRLKISASKLDSTASLLPFSTLVKDINLSSNDFTCIPNEFNQLKLLIMDNNKISSIIAKSVFTQLVALYLRNNKISDMQGIHSFPSLIVIDIRDNMLTDLGSTAEHLGSLGKLSKIFIAGNPITSQVTITFYI